ncbi:trypsin-like peptidase domain-containing protein [Pseudoalteromonas sp. JBTF-M23]|uniref:Trypsin-like peptidase domain-containing protein n=1 Tax=Pseudoalteromonas caenipelagi TaxID=2726988 RepID=A0A849V8Y7_9GAMM|nr:trypsin-like peptidase domain-containing protein [Pseudoalteromonas caenipelagi]NOU49686.1 trypsin-like peptidase domain-containing protein [Pseudoalteromonas caenipelagi]
MTYVAKEAVSSINSNPAFSKKNGIKCFLLSMVIALSSCGSSRVYQGKELAIAYLNNSNAQHNVREQEVTGYQVRISYQINGSTTVSGMGVPVTERLIVTADHVVRNLTVGQSVDVQMGEIGKLSKPVAAQLVMRSPEKDLAYLKLTQHVLPRNAVPSWCDNHQLGDKVSMTKLSGSATLTVASGTLSGITDRPRMTDSFNEKAANNGVEPNSMLDEPVNFVLLHRNMQGGFSGGAMFSVNNNCVTGISSMVASFNDLAQPQRYESVKEALNRKYWSQNSKVLAFGIPTKTILQYAKGL